MAQYPDAQPSIPRATDSDYSDDPVVGFPALTDRLADEVEAITSELGTDPSGASATVKARIEAVESGKVSTSDSRLTDARTPTAHASSHGSAGSDPVTVTQSQVTNLTTDLGALDTRLDAIETNANPTYVLVRNATGATLSKGTLVYPSGANGDNVQVSKALATSDATSARTLGFTTTNIANGADGYVIVEGYLTGVDTSSAAAGTIIYLSGTTAGGWTTTAPVAPIHYVQVGVVTRSNANTGSIFVKVQNGYELHEIHDVLLVSEANGDLLKYDSATGLWKNSPQSTLAISQSQVANLTTDLASKVDTTDARLSDSRTPTSHTHAEADVTGLVTDLGGKVGTARAINTTAPLSGGGDLSADRTLAIADASTTAKGAVQLNSATNSTSTTEAATPSAVKSAYDLANGAIPKSTVTAVGDLIVGNGSGAVTNLAKGSSGQVLQASAFGLQWATPSSGGYSTVQDEGTARTARSTLDFQGYGVSATDDATNSKTVVTVQGNYETPAVNSHLAPLFTTWDTDLANATQIIHFCRIVVPVSGMSFSTLKFKCKTAGASSSIRFGVYNANNAINFYAPTGTPIDWGTVNTSSSGGFNLSLTLPSVWQPTAGIYWLACVSQGTNNSTVAACSTFTIDHVLPSLSTTTGSWAWKSNSTYSGALPTSPPVSGTTTVAPLLVVMRSA